MFFTGVIAGETRSPARVASEGPRATGQEEVFLAMRPFGSGRSRTTVSCSSLANRDNLVNPAPAWHGEGQALALR